MSNLNEMNTKELKEMAKELKVKNWWTLKKAELIVAIEAVQTETPESVQDESESAVETACNNVIEETEEAAQNEPETTEEVANDEVIEETQNDENNGWELIAKQQLNNAYNWIVSGNKNAVTDGEMSNEDFNKWIADEALDEVYHEAITTEYHEDACGNKAPSEMRFAGKKFCYEYLRRLFKRDGYKVGEKKQKGKDLIEYDGKVQNLSQWAKELGMPGQTLFARIHLSGWTVEKAFTTPIKKRNKKEEEA